MCACVHSPNVIRDLEFVVVVIFISILGNHNIMMIPYDDPDENKAK